MTSTIDPKTIGKPQRARRHVRTLTGTTASTMARRQSGTRLIALTGYLPEVDATGKEHWPRGDETVWKSALRGVDEGEHNQRTRLIQGLNEIASRPDVPSITKSIVNHVQTSLARQPYNLGA